MTKTKEKYLLKEIAPYAEKLRNDLAELCHQCEVAGSIRRQKAEVSDIEIVCIPRVKPKNRCMGGLFDDTFSQIVREKAERVVKGNTSGKYMQFITQEGYKVDLFMTTPEQWGVIYWMRTGSNEFNMKMLQLLKKRGYRCQGGYIYPMDNAKPVTTKTEQDVFNLAGIDFVKPENRI